MQFCAFTIDEQVCISPFISYAHFLRVVFIVPWYSPSSDCNGHAPLNNQRTLSPQNSIKSFQVLSPRDSLRGRHSYLSRQNSLHSTYSGAPLSRTTSFRLSRQNSINRYAREGVFFYLCFLEFQHEFMRNHGSIINCINLIFATLLWLWFCVQSTCTEPPKFCWEWNTKRWVQAEQSQRVSWCQVCLGGQQRWPWGSRCCRWSRKSQERIVEAAGEYCASVLSLSSTAEFEQWAFQVSVVKTGFKCT